MTDFWDPSLSSHKPRKREPATEPTCHDHGVTCPFNSRRTYPLLPQTPTSTPATYQTEVVCPTAPSEFQSSRIRNTFLLNTSRLRQSWFNALDLVQSQFRQLLTSPASDWKRVPAPPSASDGSGTPSHPDVPQLQLKNKGKARANGHTSDSNNVKLSRKSTKAGDVYRVQLDVTLAPEDTIPLDSWKSVLVTPEFRKEWDPTVENSTLIEMLDPTTRISKTNFTLGWPA